MNTTKAKHTSHVQPSSRDPITNWLDVFTKLLAVPPAEKARIRDELEDHLRMRVEDLLILGMTEPEAVQKAVAELGETAELAKGFKEARTSSRRRLLMHTALFAAAGLALTMSVANILPGSNHTMPTTNPAEIALAQPEQGEQKNGYLGYDIEGGLLEDVLMNLGEAAGSRVFVHWGSLDLVGIDREMEVGAIPSKGLELSKVRELLNSMLGLEGGDELTARDDDGLLEFATVSYFDRRELITLDHDVSDLVPADHILDYTSEAENLRNGIMQVIEPSIWNSEIGAVVVNGSQLSVRAPERVQAQIIDYIERLRKLDRERTRELEIEQSVLEQEEEMWYHNQLANNTRKLEEISRALSHNKQQRSRISFDYWVNQYNLYEMEDQYKQAEPGELREELRGRLIRAQAELEELTTERDEVDQERKTLKRDEQNLRNSILVAQNALAGLGKQNGADEDQARGDR